MSAPSLPDLAGHHARLVTEQHLKTGRALLDLLAVPEGASVLELGCGTGLFGATLAQAVGPRGDVLGLDASPYHIGIAIQRGQRNLRFQVGDVERLARFPDGCFHAVLANDQLPTWADAPAVLRQLWRVIKPGGRLAVSAPCRSQPHPVRAVHDALMQRPPYADHPQPPGTAVDSGELAALLADAGFADVQVSARPEPQQYASVQAALAAMEAASWGRFLAHLPTSPDNLRAQALAEITTTLLMRRGADGLKHEGSRLLGVGTHDGG